jgi:amino acid transporter
MWIARLTGFAAVLNLFVAYVAFFVPAAASGPARAAIVVLITTALTAVNFFGVRRAALLNNALTLAKLVPLAAFVIGGVLLVHPDRLLPGGNVSLPAVLSAIMLAIYAFSGFELLAVPGGEVRDPARDIPFALLAGLGVVALVYAGVQIVCVGIVPSLGSSERPLADAARLAVGPGGAAFMAVGALLSTLGVSHTIVLAAARLPFAMAEQGQAPSVLAAVHPRYRTPHVSLFLSAGCLLVLTLATTFISAVTLTVGFRVLVYLLTCAALPVLRRSRILPRASWRAPAGDLVATVSVLTCAALLAARPWSETRQLALAVGAGLVAYWLIGRGSRAAA